MPQPTISDVHIDAILTNISVAYMQRAENMIADKVFPVVPVDKKSNKYFKYDKNDWFRDEAQRRAPGTESAGGGYNLSTDTYSADVWAFHKDVDDQTLANADTPLNPLREAAEFVTQATRDLLAGKFPLTKLTITKSLRSEYKDPSRIAHKVLADRIGERDPGNKPSTSDRIPYVYISHGAGPVPKLQGDRIELPSYIKEKGR